MTVTSNTLLQGEKRGRCTSSEADRFFETIIGLPMMVHALAEYEPKKIIALARAHKLTSYDATYPHISRPRGLTLYTKDRALLEALETTANPE